MGYGVTIEKVTLLRPAVAGLRRDKAVEGFFGSQTSDVLRSGRLQRIRSQVSVTE